jgi:pentatricopeptide repeat protein
MIKGYFRQGDLVQANKLFTEMKNKGIRHSPRKGNERRHDMFDLVIGTGMA